MPTQKYWLIIKNDETRYAKEKERICDILNDKYHNNEVYKQKKKEQALANYYRKKALKNKTTDDD